MKTLTFLLSLWLLPNLAFAENGVQLTLSSQLSPAFLKATAPAENQYQLSQPDLIHTETPALQKMISYALSLSDTPYRRSGMSQTTGFDCSGFVSHVFHQTLGIKLAHSARDIWTEGEKVDVASLVPGDLVFYNTMRRKLSHVGIYIGNGRFVHSASHGGVRVDNMHTAYWQPRWNGARRIAAVKS